MKQQRLKFKLLALILFGMFALLAVYGGYSISTYGNSRPLRGTGVMSPSTAA